MPVLKPIISYFLQGSTFCGSSVAGVTYVQSVKITWVFLKKLYKLYVLCIIDIVLFLTNCTSYTLYT